MCNHQILYHCSVDLIAYECGWVPVPVGSVFQVDIEKVGSDSGRKVWSVFYLELTVLSQYIRKTVLEET